MARPNKQGVEYFPLDVHLDDKFKFIEIKYKLEGFAVLVKLLQKIYSCGYWYKWTDDENALFADEIRADYDLVKNVVAECIKREVFDSTMYTQFKILTSKGIQKRYKEIVRRRKDVEVITDYLLVDDNFGVNDVIKSSLRKPNDVKSTQSKVKESKGKESKESSTENDAGKAFKTFEKLGFGTLNSVIGDTIGELVDSHGTDRVVNAMEEAVLHGARNMKYVMAILNNPNSSKPIGGRKGGTTKPTVTKTNDQSGVDW